MVKTIAYCGAAFALIAIGWAIHPGIGITIAVLAYWGLDGLLSRD